MRKCPKCLLEVADDSKICRVCGAILEESEAVPEQPAQAEEEAMKPPIRRTRVSTPFDPANEPLELQSISSQPWKCITCSEQVEANFDICWNCGTSRDGVEDPEFANMKDVDPQEPTDALLEPANEGGADELPPDRWCRRCGSQKIIPDVAIGALDEHSGGKLKASVVANPAAFIFRDRMSAEIRADICGKCGHVELRVDDPEALYDHYLSRQA